MMTSRGGQLSDLAAVRQLYPAGAALLQQDPQDLGPGEDIKRRLALLKMQIGPRAALIR